MVCEGCHSKDAIVHYQEIIDGNYSEIHLCEECAKKKGLDVLSALPPLGLASLIAGLAELDKEPVHEKGVVRECEGCGLTYAEFKEKGRVGCSHCYRSFEPQLRHILRKIHGNIQHTGKHILRVVEEEEIANLKKELERAVKSEEYEKAAQLRDRIRALEVKRTKRNGS
jgi:protein arginine kinase activator